MILLVGVAFMLGVSFGVVVGCVMAAAAASDRAIQQMNLGPTAAGVHPAAAAGAEKAAAPIPLGPESSA